MTPANQPEPTLEQKIEGQRNIIARLDDPEALRIANGILASLKELAASKSQPVPAFVPVAWRWKPKSGTIWHYDPADGWLSRQKDTDIDKEPIYGPEAIDALQSALQVAQKERDIERGRSATRAAEGIAGCFYKPDVENPRWCRPGSLSELRGFYQGALSRMIPAARKCGYALGVHGSMQRDLDLIAAPWVADHADKNELAKQLQIAACGIHADSYQWGASGEKPCGRVGTVFAICNPEFNKGITSSLGCVDLAVMPDTSESESSNKRLVELLREPSEEMVKAGKIAAVKTSNVTAVFKAMAAELLREVGK